jgi:hypothetical protein
MPINISLFGSKYASANYGTMYLMFSWCNVSNILYLSKHKADFNTACNILGTITLLGVFNSWWLIKGHAEYKKKQHAASSINNGYAGDTELLLSAEKI